MLYSIIRFKEEPKDLEKTLDFVPVLKKTDDFEYKWKNHIGEIILDVYKKPYSVQVSSFDNSGITRKRIENLTKRISRHYNDCKVEYSHSMIDFD